MPPLPGLTQASSTLEGPEAKFTIGTARIARARTAKHAIPARLAYVMFIKVSCAEPGRPRESKKRLPREGKNPERIDEKLREVMSVSDYSQEIDAAVARRKNVGSRRPARPPT
jgi:hypothetical protein